MRRLALVFLMGIMAGCGSRYVVRTYDRPDLEAQEETAEERGEEGKSGVLEEDYTVGEGETLKSIARKTLGKEFLWRHIYEWNKLKEDVSPGQKVKIPKHFAFLAEGVVEAPRPKPDRIKPKPAARRPETVFRPGEKLYFDVKWFALTAGKASMEVRGLSLFRGVPCYHFVATAKSGLLFFFKVHDWIESRSTSDELLPLRFDKHLQEGNYKKDIAADFDPAAGKVKWGDQEAELAQEARDLLGSFYYFRTMNLPELGGKMTVAVHTDRKNYELEISVLRREVIKVPAGEFKTVLIQPRLMFEGLWKQKGDVLIWLTDDESRIPVLVVSKVFLLGSVDIVLTGMERP